MNRKWHDTDKLSPKAEQVIVGLWESLSQTFVGLCYYDRNTHEWFSADTDGVDTAIQKPDYWVELPYD